MEKEKALQVFSNGEFHARTVTDEDGTIWFVAKDIAQVLEYKEASLNQTNNLFNFSRACFLFINVYLLKFFVTLKPCIIEP